MIGLLKKFLGLSAFVLSLLFLCVAANALYSPRRDLFYLFDIFTLPLFSVSLLFACVLGPCFRFKLIGKTPLIVSGLAVALMGLSLSPLIFSPAKPKNPDAPVSLVFANLWAQNKSPEKLAQFIAAKNPDVVVIIENNHLAIERLHPTLRQTYPFRARRFDMVIFSKYPLKNPKARPAGNALLTATVEAPQQEFTLAVAHLTRPWPFAETEAQARQFDRLKRELSPYDHDDLVLVGDFNSTVVARPLMTLNKDLNLKPATGFGGTWPTGLPSFMRIGIDNVMAGQDWVIRDRQVGPHNGSDHRPVFVTLWPRERQQAIDPAP